MSAWPSRQTHLTQPVHSREEGQLRWKRRPLKPVTCTRGEGGNRKAGRRSTIQSATRAPLVHGPRHNCLEPPGLRPRSEVVPALTSTRYVQHVI
eukprot:scaffold8477_cov112-Isochrysis_galbana.AAC.11